MDQEKMRVLFEASCANDQTKANLDELSQKLALIVGGARQKELVCMINAKTGEKFYTRCRK